MDKHIPMILSAGYAKKFFGYRKVTENYSHWITLFDESLQMYGYHTDDPEMEKVYDTGMITVESDNLNCLIDIWSENYK